MKLPVLPRDQVWSACPTPFDDRGRVDAASVARMMDHHAALGVTGVMLAGTCGEGPWLRDRDREELTRAAASAARGRVTVTMQVTDNSAGRVLDNIERAASWGASIAVVSSPAFFFNINPSRLPEHYAEIARHSVLPLGFYDRGKATPYVLPGPALRDLLADPKIVLVKDSSVLPEHRTVYLAARAARPELRLFTGSEFDCDDYLAADYDGLLLGGGVFNGAMARKIVAAARAGNPAEARRLQERMNDLMYRVYGGKKIECWMSGLKELLVQLGVFSTRRELLGYPLTDSCRDAIAAAVSGRDGLGFADELRGR